MRRIRLFVLMVTVGCGVESVPVDGAMPRDASHDVGSMPRRDAQVADVDGGGPPEGTVPMIVGSGEGWRTIVSYGDGRTWVHGHAIDSRGTDCSVIDCSHHPGNSLGIAYGDGWFFAEFGNVERDGVQPTV